MEALRLIVEASIQEARSLLEPDFSMRSSSLNMPLQVSQHQAQFQQTFESIRNDYSRKESIGLGFEDIGGLQEQKSIE